MTNHTNIDPDDESWLHRGPAIDVQLNCSAISEYGLGCVTQEEMQKMRRQ